MRLVNLTPHTIKFYATGGAIYTFYPENPVRCFEAVEYLYTLDCMNGVPIFRKSFGFRRRFGQINILPEPQDDVFYIVSAIVAQNAPKTRCDLVVPHDIVREERNYIIGCRAFIFLS